MAGSTAIRDVIGRPWLSRKPRSVRLVVGEESSMERGANCSNFLVGVIRTARGVVACSNQFSWAVLLGVLTEKYNILRSQPFYAFLRYNILHVSIPKSS